MTMTYQSVWIPGKDVKRYSGSDIPQDMNFFIVPPYEIGQVISAEGSLKGFKNTRWSFSRISTYLMYGFMGVLAGLLVFSIILSLLRRFDIWLLIVLGIIGGLAYLFYQEKMTERCSFVGEKGISIHILKHKSAIPKTKILCFQDATNLYTSQTRNYVNGIYTGTSYDYKWEKLKGRNYRIAGHYYSEKGSPEDKDPFHFAIAAELAWIAHLLQNVEHQLDRLGYVEFLMKGKIQAVRIGHGFMEFVDKEGAHRVMISDMREITINSRICNFQHKDAKWWSGKGNYSFFYGTIPNARLFRICLERLTGIRWS
jgi:hypothetical protein